MRAARVAAHTGPDAVAIEEVPEPAAGENVLVAVAHAGMGFVDYLQTLGLYQDRHDPPFTLGMEIAGRVLSAPAASGLAEGERVMGFVPIGGFAEVVAVAPELTFPLPDAVSTVDGAAMILNYQTAAVVLIRRTSVQPGERVLVLGAGGGVGTACVQMARLLGAHVIGVASSAEKAAAARAAGAHEAIAISECEGEWREVVRAAHPDGVEVVVDPVGGDRFADGMRVLASEGRIAVVGFASGDIPKVALNRVLLRNATVVGAAWGELLKRDGGLGRDLHERMLGWLEAGELRPVVDRVLPFESVSEGLRDIGANAVGGKLVLEIGAEAPH